jgi:hypothetical protein
MPCTTIPSNCAAHADSDRDLRNENAMLDRSLKAEFEYHRKTLPTDEVRQAFDTRIEHLLSQHGIDYVRGYVAGLKDAVGDHSLVRN